MSKLKGSPACLDCGVLHGRRPQAALCLPCRHTRRLTRNRTPKYRAYQTRWNRSARAKITKGRWYEMHREQRLAELRVRYASLPKVPRVVSCATLLCPNTFIRPKRNRRKFCLECVLIFHGASYARHRLDWIPVAA